MTYQRDFENRLKIAVVGIGSHSYRNILPALNYLPVELKALCNHSNKEVAEKTASQYGCRSYQDTREMYEKEDLDAVFISVSPEMHGKLVEEALEAGLHVFVEKPAAMNAKAIEEVIKKKGNRVVVVGYKKAFMPAMRKAIEVCKSPEYGHLESILAVYPMKMPEDGAAAIRDNKRTDMLNNGCHPLSVLLAAGGPVDSVISVQGPFHNGANILKFKNGVIGTFYLASGPQPVEDYHFYAAKWHLQIENTTKVILQRGIPFVYGKTTSFVPEGFDHGALVWEAQNCKATLENKALFVQGMYNEMMYFCECVQKGMQPEIGSLEFALELQKVTEALMLSQGKEIKIV
jgi:predicted dehydrogenase